MKRFLALLLSFVMMFSVVAKIGLLAVAEQNEEDLDWKNAMHFIIEHWHAVDVPGGTGNGNENLVRVEGYIVSHILPNGDEEFLFFYDEEGKIPITTDNPNIGDINPGKGTITLSVQPYTQSGGRKIRLWRVLSDSPLQRDMRRLLSMMIRA